MLAAGARSAISVDAAVGLIDGYFDLIVNYRIHADGSKAGMAAAGAVERRNAH